MLMKQKIAVNDILELSQRCEELRRSPGNRLHRAGIETRELSAANKRLRDIKIAFMMAATDSNSGDLFLRTGDFVQVIDASGNIVITIEGPTYIMADCFDGVDIYAHYGDHENDCLDVKETVILRSITGEGFRAVLKNEIITPLKHAKSFDDLNNTFISQV